MFKLFKNKSPSTTPNVIDVANYFIVNLEIKWEDDSYFSSSYDYKISRWDYSRLYGLCYLSQVWSLVLNKKLLFDETIFETSTSGFTANYGVYIYELRKYLESIKKKKIDKQNLYNFNKDDEFILQEIIRVYGNTNKIILNRIITRDDAYKSAESESKNHHNKIDMELAYNYYNNLYLESLK